MTETKLIGLSLAACRILRPVYTNPYGNTQDEFASKILSKMSNGPVSG